MKNLTSLTVWEKLFIKKNEDLVMNFDFLFENDLIRKWTVTTSLMISQKQLRMGRMAPLKIFLNLREFCGV